MEATGDHDMSDTRRSTTKLLPAASAGLGKRVGRAPTVISQVASSSSPSPSTTTTSAPLSTMVRPSSIGLRLSQARPANLSARTRVHQRFASSTSDAQKKAQETLASAQKQLGQAVETGKKYLGPLGERAGSMLGGYREPLVYNYQVARELLKQVYVAERLQPPTSWSTISFAYSTLWSRASNPAYLRQLVQSGDWAKIGVYALEAYGIFKIGEIIGRTSLVGYKVE